MVQEDDEEEAPNAVPLHLETLGIDEAPKQVPVTLITGNIMEMGPLNLTKKSQRLVRLVTMQDFWVLVKRLWSGMCSTTTMDTKLL
jgi:hypothetical protein